MPEEPVSTTPCNTAEQVRTQPDSPPVTTSITRAAAAPASWDGTTTSTSRISSLAKCNRPRRGQFLCRSSFVSATGNASTFDLRLQAVNPAESQGVLIASVTDDFDGQTRSSLTPVDIGADAGNFTFLEGMAPIVTGNLQLSHTSSNANRVLTDFAAISDSSGVSTGANAPRIYFKKSTDADVFGVANDSTAATVGSRS